jgi:hypothetical protein
MDPYTKIVVMVLLIYLIVGVVVATGYAMSEKTRYRIISHILIILLWPLSVYDVYRNR